MTTAKTESSLITSRREVLAGAAAIAGAAALGAAPLALTPAGAQPAGLAVRQDIVTFAQDATRFGNFQAALKEMQDRSQRDPNDPKGWLVNANAHNDFCAVPAPDGPDQIHFCYWFLAWHRAYITVTERKIREISGDQSLAYPYWNWSSDRRIPQPFAGAGNPLGNAVRFTPNRPLADAEVDFHPDDPDLQQLVVGALASTFFEATTPDDIGLSFGGIARPNQFNAFDNNRLEGTPHGPVHVYVGGTRGSREGDMTEFSTAGRDPIFFGHHGNLDRLWEIWRQDPARKATEPSADAFLSHPFVFTWLDGTQIQVIAGDTLDASKLGFMYDNMQVLRPGAPPLVIAQAAENRLPAVGSSQIRVPVSPQTPRPNERKVLEITDVETPPAPITVGVYVKPAGAPASDTGTEVGSFTAVRSGGRVVLPKTLRFDVTAAANRFAGQEITVELVPHRISTDTDEHYAPLKYGKMEIVSRTRR
jgi:hypothetical protein